MLVEVDKESFSVMCQRVAAIEELLKEKSPSGIYNELMDRDQASKYLKIDPSYLDRLRRNLIIPFAKFEKKVLFKRSDLDKWVNDHIVTRKI